MEGGGHLQPGWEDELLREFVLIENLGFGGHGLDDADLVVGRID